ncbi:MAG TPA: terminase [Micromonosporaceae bacterium]
MTEPLRDLADPDSSWGYDFADFCELIGYPLDPWERGLAIRLGELFPDGTPRYRKAIILVARQNGKTIFTRLLILYWMWIDRAPETLATSTDRAAAKRSWLKVIKMAEANELLRRDLPPRHTALQIGEEAFWNSFGSTYRFAAPTRRAGRGETIDRAVLDELREHRSRDVWDAVIPAMGAVADALVVCISNEGDEESIVLHEEFDAAAAGTDPRAFFAAWSAPPGADPLDLEALAYANPNLGHRISVDALLGEARSAVRAGGETLTRFQIERMCQRVDKLNPAIDAAAWARCLAPAPIADRGRLALVVDAAPDLLRATAYAAAAQADGRVRLDFVREWTGQGCVDRAMVDLPGLVDRVRPKTVGWIPGGPMAAAAAKLKQRQGWPPPGVTVEEIRGDVPAICMGFAELVAAGKVAHSGDPLLDDQVRATEPLRRGDVWVFSRRGAGHCDALYAAAGAAHLARLLPAPVRVRRLVVAS